MSDLHSDVVTTLSCNVVWEGIVLIEVDHARKV
jgi:hypothetical protein